MLNPAIRKSAMTVAALAALGLGGAAIAGAADKTTSSGSSRRADATPRRSARSSRATSPPRSRPPRWTRSRARPCCAPRPAGPYGSAYHAHIKTSDGTLKVVLVNSSFEATAVQADQGRGGRRAGAATAAPAALAAGRDRADR